MSIARLLTRWRWFRELVGGLWIQTDHEGWQLIGLPDNLSEYPPAIAIVMRERWRRTAPYVGMRAAGGYETTRTDHGYTLRDIAGDVIGAALLAQVLAALVQPRELLPVDLLEQLEDAEQRIGGAS